MILSRIYEITHPFGLNLICKHSALGCRVNKSDKNLMGVLQLIHVAKTNIDVVLPKTRCHANTLTL